MASSSRQRAERASESLAVNALGTFLDYLQVDVLPPIRSEIETQYDDQRYNLDHEYTALESAYREMMMGRAHTSETMAIRQIFMRALDEALMDAEHFDQYIMRLRSGGNVMNRMIGRLALVNTELLSHLLPDTMETTHTHSSLWTPINWQWWRRSQWFASIF
jgi:hypothetical protein